MNEKDRIGWTPLHFACRSGHTATAVALIERGASVNEKSQFGWTPLHWACGNGRSATAIALLENGAVGLNDRNIFENTLASLTTNEPFSSHQCVDIAKHTAICHIGTVA